MRLGFAAVSILTIGQILLAQNETGIKMTVRQKNNVPLDVVVPGFSVDFGGVLPQLNIGATSGPTLPGYCSSGQFFHRTTNNSLNICSLLGSWIEVGSGGSGAVNSVFSRTGAVVAQTGDYTAAQITNAVDTTQTYSNPAWISTLAAVKITNLAAIAISGSASDLSTGTVPTVRLGSGAANNTTFLRGDQTWATITGGGGPTACEIVIGDPGVATPILADDNDTPAVCANVSGTTQTITAIACWAHAGSPTVRPIISGGASNSLLSSDLTCGPQTYAPGTLNGTPTLANGATIDANIASAGGVAKYLVIRITRQ